MMEKIDFECELKLSDATDAIGAIDGYASVFGILDRGGDIVMPGAFKASLAEWRRKKSPIPMLWNHNPDQPIGIWQTFSEDEKGLKIAGELIMEDPEAVKARVRIQKGAVKGLSIGYRTQEHEIDRLTGARRLKKVDLWEVSLVTFPMLPEAQITSVKTGLFDPGFAEKLGRVERGLLLKGFKADHVKLAAEEVAKVFAYDDSQDEAKNEPKALEALMGLRKLNSTLSV